MAAIVAAPLTAVADEPTPAPAPAPAPASAPTDSGGAPGETPPTETPKVDPAYGEHPERETRHFPAPKGTVTSELVSLTACRPATQRAIRAR